MSSQHHVSMELWGGKKKDEKWNKFGTRTKFELFIIEIFLQKIVHFDAQVEKEWEKGNIVLGFVPNDRIKWGRTRLGSLFFIKVTLDPHGLTDWFESMWAKCALSGPMRNAYALSGVCGLFRFYFLCICLLLAIVPDKLILGHIKHLN